MTSFLCFPNSDLRTAKRRPALVLQRDNLASGLEQTIVAMISSNPARGNHPSRVAVPLRSDVSKSSGLRLDSWIMTDNLATVLDSGSRFHPRTDAGHGRTGSRPQAHLGSPVSGGEGGVVTGWRTEDRGRRTEDGGRRTEDGGGRHPRFREPEADTDSTRTQHETHTTRTPRRSRRDSEVVMCAIQRDTRLEAKNEGELGRRQ